MAGLAVNVDHVATLRNARGGNEPDPVHAAVLVELAGADGVVVHLRGDRRHIKDRDVYLIRQIVRTKMILEMAPTEEMLAIACKVKPHQATLVPERRMEITTEGGLDIAANRKEVVHAIETLHKEGILVSLFIDQDQRQVSLASEVGADVVELHTGAFCEANTPKERSQLFEHIALAARQAHSQGLVVHAGHGLGYKTLEAFFDFPEIAEFSIGHSIISRAVFVGLEAAVGEMLDLVRQV
jgi:pyridoxine 5-phosphate synthase